MGNEFVMVPREPTPEMLAAAKKSGVIDPRVSGYCYELMVAAAPKHQGEPVALPARKKTTAGLLSDSNTYNLGWNACLDEIAKLGPLYTNPVPTDPAEVDRLAILLRQVQVKHAQERDTLRTQLADTYALLREIHDGTLSGYERYSKIEATLSASAEPSAPAEVDERAEPKPDAWRASINGNWEYFRSYEQALKELRQWQSDYLPEELEEAKADGLYEPEPIYSRAALERKP